MKPHGLKGEVTISPTSDATINWLDLKTIYGDQNGSLLPFFIEKASIHADKVLVKFEDLATSEQASELKNISLYLPKNSRPLLEEGEFYDDEIIDYQVVDETSGILGQVIDIERAGVNRFLILNYQQKEIMIPVQYPLLQRVDKSKREITVNLPDGFLDI